MKQSCAVCGPGRSVGRTETLGPALLLVQAAAQKPAATSVPNSLTTAVNDGQCAQLRGPSDRRGETKRALRASNMGGHVADSRGVDAGS